MKLLLTIFTLAFLSPCSFSQKDSLILKLCTKQFDKTKLTYSVKLEFISMKKNEIWFQLEPRYIMPNEIDGVGFSFEHLEDDCYKSFGHSEVQALPDYDIPTDHVKKISLGDTATIIF